MALRAAWIRLTGAVDEHQSKNLERLKLRIEFIPGSRWRLARSSYGFRPGRSAHQALSKLRDTMMEMGGGWALEVDIRKYFDTIDHAHLRTVLRQRIGDGVVLRLIGKWLNAGVMEGGELSYPESGTPQGGVVRCWRTSSCTRCWTRGLKAK